MELLERCKKGDKDSKRMMCVICHYIPDLNAARDILHDGFLIIFSRINQLRDAEKLEYWMGTIMKNLALQYSYGVSKGVQTCCAGEQVP